MTEEPHHRSPRSASSQSPGADVGITEDMVRDLVHAFYARVRVDPILGPIFNQAVENWDQHLAKLCDFWSSVTLMTGRYKGTPMRVHAELPDIDDVHFDAWLKLFEKTATEICPPPAANLFADRAHRIAQSLKMGIAAHRGTIDQLLATAPNLSPQ